MSRRGWLFLAGGVAVAVLAFFCIATIGVTALLTQTDVTKQLGLDSSPKYEVVNDGRVSTKERLRWQTDIVLANDPKEEEWVGTVAKVARAKLKDNPELKAVVIQAFDTQSNFKRGLPKTLAMLSSDGKGWAGDGSLLLDTDEGEIQVVFAKKFEDGKISDFNAYSCKATGGSDCTKLTLRSK